MGLFSRFNRKTQRVVKKAGYRAKTKAYGSRRKYRRERRGFGSAIF